MSGEVDDSAVRVEAVEALLLEKGLIDPEVVDQRDRALETSVGPLNGARVVARAWTDPPFRERLLADGTEAIAEFGFGGPEGQMIVAVENTPAVHNVVVCTLCSATRGPFSASRPPGTSRPGTARGWSPSRERPSARWGSTVPDEVRIRVWDSSAEARYLVLPERPEGTGDLDPEDSRLWSPATR